MHPMITACTGFDVLTHAIESYTARPFSDRPKATDPNARPLSQVMCCTMRPQFTFRRHLYAS